MLFYSNNSNSYFGNYETQSIDKITQAVFIINTKTDINLICIMKENHMNSFGLNKYLVINNNTHFNGLELTNEIEENLIIWMWAILLGFRTRLCFFCTYSELQEKVNCCDIAKHSKMICKNTTKSY